MSTVVTPTTTRYRPHPRPFKDSGEYSPFYGQAAKEKQCARTKGHVLIITPKGIECVECGAEWENIGH
jgi:hypothetical protein